MMTGSAQTESARRGTSRETNRPKSGMQSPLAGARVVNTRSPSQAPELDRLLRERGAEPLAYPCIDIAPPPDPGPLRHAVARLGAGAFDWVVFTSANAVEAVATQTGRSPLPPNWTTRTRVAVVGPGTAAALAGLLGVTPDLCPTNHLAEALGAQLVAQGARRVLVPHADKARETLVRVLTEGGVEVKTVVAYRTVLGCGGVDVPRLLQAGQIDALVFASPSAVDNMAARFEAEGGEWGNLRSLCIACIGPVTATAAQKRGLTVSVRSADHTLRGIVDELERFYAEHPRSGGTT